MPATPTLNVKAPPAATSEAFEFVFQTAVHELFGLTVNKGRTVGQPSGEGIALSVQIVIRHHEIYQAHVGHLLCRKAIAQ